MAQAIFQGIIHSLCTAHFASSLKLKKVLIPIVYSKLLYKMGNYFLDTYYIHPPPIIKKNMRRRGGRRRKKWWMRGKDGKRGEKMREFEKWSEMLLMSQILVISITCWERNEFVCQFFCFSSFSFFVNYSYKQVVLINFATANSIFDTFYLFHFKSRYCAKLKFDTFLYRVRFFLVACNFED